MTNTSMEEVISPESLSHTVLPEEDGAPSEPNNKRHLDADSSTITAIDGSKKSKMTPEPTPTPAQTLTHGIKVTQALPASQQPITREGEMPQKKYYRSRAHCNPLSHNDIFDYPKHPGLMDWSAYYPPATGTADTTATTDKSAQNQPTVLDVGCGFGGLTLALARQFGDDERVLGMEIRNKVTEYVRLRIVAHRHEARNELIPTTTTTTPSDTTIPATTSTTTPSDTTENHNCSYANVSVMRINAMKYLPNYFVPHSIAKLFICFPDPHFKRKNFPRRIISLRLLTEYAHVLRKGGGGGKKGENKPGGRLYAITDVEELHKWHLEKCNAHPLFRKCTEEEMRDDPCVELMKISTEEGKKVDREGRNKYWAVYQRLSDAEVLEKEKAGNGSGNESVSDFFKEGNFGVNSVEAVVPIKGITIPASKECDEKKI